MNKKTKSRTGAESEQTRIMPPPPDFIGFDMEVPLDAPNENYFGGLAHSDSPHDSLVLLLALLMPMAYMYLMVMFVG